MGNGKLAKRLLQNLWRAPLEINAPLRSSNLTTSVTAVPEKLKPQLPNKPPHIYRVPTNMRQVEIKAYDPNIVSVGPYHRGVARLQAMEEVKRKFLGHLFDPSREHGATLDTLFNAMKNLEGEARACYSETINLSSDEFVETMLVDGCFILELFRESSWKNGTTCEVPIFTTRWMLPVLRRDLIMLENQIPLVVLSKIFDLTHSTKSSSTLIHLALKFFNPLMPRDEKTLNVSSTRNLVEEKHLLGLFRSSLLPKESSIERGKQPHMFRSIKELKEAGVKLRKRETCSPLDINFRKGVLEIPRLLMDDYTGTLFRNIVAFEQCHLPSKPDFTSYLFFIDSLINTAQDIGLLHYAGVIQHSLGSDEALANLFNKLCREVARDVDESYLHKMSEDLNKYCNRNFNRWRAQAVHNFFSSPGVLISSIAAFIFFLVTLAQAYFDYRAYDNSMHPPKKEEERCDDV